MIAQGTFREDLFYRLNVIHLTVPPLRERREDIPALVEHFLHQFSGNNGHGGQDGDAGAMRYLCDYPWPGNVRELENVIERLVVTGRSGDRSRSDDLPVEIRMHHGRRSASQARAAAHGR